MSKVTFRVVVAALTFCIGITAAVIWVSKTNKRFADDVYFPVGVFSPREVGQNWIVKFYSSSLAAMEEPALWPPKDKDAEAYRFLWLRSFHPPVSIRLYRVGGQRFMSVKQLSDVGVPLNGEAIFPKTLAFSEARVITDAEWAEFQRLLDKSGFWSMPTEDGTEVGLDGAGWLLEGARLQQYHVVERWSPRQGDFRDTCVFLLRFSGLSVDESKGELY
jgi:hypothetical protein